MKKTQKFCLSLLAVTTSLTLPFIANAAVDYGSLQSIFNEPVTLSATGTPQRVSEVSANMTIVTADDIRRSGTRSIPQIIGIYVPGMDTLQTGYAGFDVGVRGYQAPSMPRLLVLVDGRQVFIDDYSRTFWNNIPVNVDDIRQIEVVKGPASALFGSNAAGGVVNIVTYSPKYDKNNVATAFAGTEHTMGGDATFTKNGEWGGTKTSIGGYNAHEFNSGNGYNPVVDGAQINPTRRYVANSSVFNIDPNFELNTEFTYAYSRQNYALAIVEQDGDKLETYSARGGFQWKTPGWGLLINDNYFNHAYDPLLGYRFTTDLAVSKLEDQFEIGSSHVFRLGLEYRRKIFKDTYDAGNLFAEAPQLSENNYAVSGTWLWKLADNLSWTNAGRFDHMDMYQSGKLPAGSYYSSSDYSHVINTFSGNSGFSYQPTVKDSFKLAYGRGVQMPSMIESALNTNFQLPTGPLLEVTGNPHLKPTMVQNYEFDYERKINDLYSTAKFGVYYQLNQDLKSFYISPSFITMNGFFPTVLYSVKNVDSSHGWGGEFELKGSKNNYRWDASYSISRVVDDAAAAAGIGYNNSAPMHHVRLIGGYTYNQWEFDANAQYLSSTQAYRAVAALSQSLEKTSAYYTMGGRVGYNYNDRLTFALSGVNINHQYIKENPYPAVERQALVSVTGKF